MSTVEFTALFDGQRVALYNFAFNLTRDEEAARDLVQETAYKAYRYLDRYEPHTNLRAWLMTILRNSFINDYRKRRRRQTLHDHTANNYLLDSGDASVHNAGESALTMQEIQSAIDTLEPWARVPFVMHCDGFKYEEISTELNVPLGTVKSRIFFARQKLQAALKSLYKSAHIRDIVD
ncbi:MAG: RNA polymerase sigma factor [Haliscomenobacter sp.]